jgi:LacI family transcriptional regulator
MSFHKEVTIFDIAKQLNLSIATVSRALNDDPVVKKKTKKRVSDLSQELGYRHNSFASNLRMKKSNTIGVIVPKLNSNFIAAVLSGIEKSATLGGYDLIIATSSEQFEKEKANVLNMFHKRVDGLIVSLAIDTKNLNHFKPFLSKKIPVFFFDRVDEESDTIKVVIDNHKCGYQLTQHLVEQGCKRIAFITASLDRNVYAQRYKGYLDAHKDHNLEAADELLWIGDVSEQFALEAAANIMEMKPLPDGIVVTSDYMAAVIMLHLKEHGIRIPDDIAIVGFNNDAISKLVEPKLTTIDYPGVDMGEIVARNMVDHLKGDTGISQTSTYIVRTQLIIRASSLKQIKKSKEKKSVSPKQL